MAFSDAGGELKNVTIVNIRCASAISAGGLRHIDILDSTIRNNGVSGDGAITLSNGVDVTITTCEFRDIEQGFGVRTQAGGATATISDSTFANVVIGAIADEGSISATNNDLAVTGAGFYGASGGTLDVTDSTIVGPGASPATGVVKSFGVGFDQGTGGSVDGNTISNFLDLGTSAISCGIFVAEDAGAVTIGTNTFPDPPGNEQNVCDNRS